MKVKPVDDLEKLLTGHESYRRHPYLDTEGHLTVGIGRNLDAVGIYRREATYLLREDIKRHRAACLNLLPEFRLMTPARQAVLISMSFNLGAKGLSKFKKTLGFLKAGWWNKAAEEMLDSRWARQVGKRAIELSDMMKTGEWG